MITSTADLQSFLDQVTPVGTSPVCAIDTEANSLHSYRESLCLVQFATRTVHTLIDPLAISDLSPLGNYLSTATVWMHGADYDMTMLKREFGTLPPVIYDTQIGARLLGVRRFGLGDLVARYFNVELSKSSQKADWGKRPLTEKMIEYALNDVHYLLEMGDIITEQLKDYDRYHWFVESCTAARERVLSRDDDSRDDLWRIQGSGKLHPLGLAILKALWHWRDAEAKAWDKPTFMVIPNRTLVEWSSLLADNLPISLPHHFRPERTKRFHNAVQEAKSAPPDSWPQRLNLRRRKPDKDFDKKVESLIAYREKVASSLDIEGSLIASRSIIESIVAEEISPSDCLLQWQIECLNLTPS